MRSVQQLGGGRRADGTGLVTANSMLMRIMDNVSRCIFSRLKCFVESLSCAVPFLYSESLHFKYMYKNTFVSMCHSIIISINTQLS